MRWQSLAPFEGRPACVYPLNDLREHDPDNPDCWCESTYDDGVLVHHSMDRREEFEQGRKVS